MKNPPLSRIGFFLVLLPLLVALGGCSLFGIATKGNLNELADKQDQEHQQLQAQVRELDQDMVRYEAEIQSARLQLQTIRMDMDTFEDGLDRATTDSKQALRIQHDSVISERDRLHQRLKEIDALILSWEQQRMLEPEGTVTPVPGGLIVPEKETETRGATDAVSASDETSVWKDRRSGTSSR